MHIAAERADTLLGARSPVAQTIEIHMTSDEAGMMRMRKIDSVALTPEQPILLEPGGTHFMLLGLTAPLAPDVQFPITLSFAKAGDITASVKVMAPNTDPKHH
jgi:hypothetical protein